MDAVGDNFQQETKYQKHRMPSKPLDWASRPPLYKHYPDSQTVILPDIPAVPDAALYDVLRNRKSVRAYDSHPLSKESLSYLLWASTGISRNEDGYAFRTAPSAGALYPIETYLVINHIKEIASGVYHYHIQDHCLELLKEGGYGVETAAAALGQQMCAEAAVVFIWTGIFQRMKWKYGQRAYRYIYLDAGHIAENLALAATSLGLGSCQIGALFDDEVNRIIEVDGNQESVVYMSVVG
jgi:SagB-type dehydrogenase family enzyme